MKALKYLSFAGKLAGFITALGSIPFVDPANPLFPALRSSPTAVQEPPAKSKFLAVAVAEAVHKVDCRPDPANQGLTGGLHKRSGKPCLGDFGDFV
jgi:hypothetical protein